MASTESIEQVEKEIGPPVLLFRPTKDDLENKRITDDIALEYRLYLSSEASGGCILYGLYDHGWVCNPSSRWVMTQMAMELKA